MSKSPPEDLFSKESSDIKNKLLWGMDQRDSDAEKIIKACSLFDTIKFTDERGNTEPIFISFRGPEEAKYIAEKICNTTYDEFYKKVQYFKSKHIIQQYGGFIQVRPKPLASWLANQLISETPPETIIQWIFKMTDPQKSDELYPSGLKIPDSTEGKTLKNSNKVSIKNQKTDKELSEKENRKFKKQNADQSNLNGLFESFWKQFRYLELSSKAQKLFGGVFGTEEALNTAWGSLNFHYFSEANPEVALNTLKKVFGNKTTNELSSIRESQSRLVGTLQKLAARKNLYPDSARLLLKFAESENEKWSNHSKENIYTSLSGIFVRNRGRGKNEI